MQIPNWLQGNLKWTGGLERGKTWPKGFDKQLLVYELFDSNSPSKRKVATEKNWN